MAKNIKKPEKLPSTIDEDDDDDEEDATVVMPKSPRKEKPVAKPSQNDVAPSVGGADKAPSQERTGEDNNQKSWLNKTTVIVAACTFVAVFVALFLFKSSPSEADKDGSGASEKQEVVEQATKMEETKMVENMKTSNQFLGECIYTGPIDSNQLPHGIGKAVFTEGNAKSYEGPFVHGEMEGDQAVYIYKNGDVFKGTFKDNHFAEGKYTTAQGEYFVGKFNEEGSPTEGTWYDKNGKEM